MRILRYRVHLEGNSGFLPKLAYVTDPVKTTVSSRLISLPVCFEGDFARDRAPCLPLVYTAGFDRAGGGPLLASYAREQMRRFPPPTGEPVAALHLIQSFDAGDEAVLTPGMALKAGRLLYEAELSYQETFYGRLLLPAVIAVHARPGEGGRGDTIHNHLLIFSYEPGRAKKPHRGQKHYEYLRDQNDEIGRRMGLRIIAEPSRGISRGEYELICQDKSWKEKMRHSIIAAVSHSFSMEEFCEELKGEGFALRIGRYITYTDREGHMARDVSLGRPFQKKEIEKLLNMGPDRDLSDLKDPVTPYIYPDMEDAWAFDSQGRRYFPIERSCREKIRSLDDLALEAKKEGERFDTDGYQSLRSSLTETIRLCRLEGLYEEEKVRLEKKRLTHLRQALESEKGKEAVRQIDLALEHGEGILCGLSICSLSGEEMRRRLVRPRPLTERVPEREETRLRPAAAKKETDEESRFLSYLEER